MGRVFAADGARDMTASMEWARQADLGDALIAIDCPHGEYEGWEIVEIEAVLAERGLTLINGAEYIVVGHATVGGV